jgi:transcriptional regulator with XRE-family HTH domain
MTEVAQNPQPMSEETARRLRERRINAGLTQAELAERADVSEAVIRRAELGAVPRPAAQAKIAAYFGLRATELWPVDEQ